MNKKTQHKIQASAMMFVEKHRPELSSVRKAEFSAMLGDFAVRQVKRFIKKD